MKSITKNKAAYMNYDITDTYEAGIILQGHEVKSIKGGHVNIKDAIVFWDGTTLVVNNMDVPLYEKAYIRMVGLYNAKGKRGLLLTKAERGKIMAKTTKTGLAIVPLHVYSDIHGRIKLTVGIGKLRRKIEKKSIIKERDITREMERDIKNYR